MITEFDYSIANQSTRAKVSRNRTTARIGNDVMLELIRETI